MLMIGLSVLVSLAGMASQLCFWAIVAYLVAKYGRKGWQAGE